MKLKAAGVGLGVMVLTVAASFPMVFVYATFIEPGHPRAFYNDAAQWIAPWSSHVFGPILFLCFQFLTGATQARTKRDSIRGCDDRALWVD
jgi:hypothetical protein